MKLLLYMFKHGRENFGYGPKNLADIGFLKGVQEQQTVPKDVGHYGSGLRPIILFIHF